jgi:hypothetical protein
MPPKDRSMPAAARDSLKDPDAARSTSLEKESFASRDIGPCFPFAKDCLEAMGLVAMAVYVDPRFRWRLLGCNEVPATAAKRAAADSYLTITFKPEGSAGGFVEDPETGTI